MGVDLTCVMCKKEPETTSHVLWTCPFARNVWALVRGRIQKSSNGVDEFLLQFRQMQSKVSKQELKLWATTVWAIWNARNKVIFEQFQTHPKIILEGATGLLEEYQCLMETQRIA